MNYSYDKEDFIINNYNRQSPFANFLPGLAGRKGIPLWAFYVNRAQGISSFGIHNKNHPILEFSPANKSYSTVGQTGFRTFIKINQHVYEPFKVNTPYEHKMIVRRNEFTIEEINDDLGIKIKVTYFGLPNETLGAIVRNVKIENLTTNNLEIELVDGIAEILPHGVSNSDFKNVSNLLPSWFVANNSDYDFAFYTLRSSTSDTSEVTKVTQGNFLMAAFENNLIKPIVDPYKIFGYDTTKTLPVNFMNKSIKELNQEVDVQVNQIPCGFIPLEMNLKGNSVFEYNLLSGNTHNIEFFNNLSKKLINAEYLVQKRIESKQLIDELVKDVETSTNSAIFDEYIKQNYLDNLLRGGYPYKFGAHVFHLYARRHGDLERDYNFFSLAPEFYSTGDGNFRDVCQNRRLDSFVHPFVKDFNIKHFFSLIQLDGYNPLIIKPMNYLLEHNAKEDIIHKHFGFESKMEKFFTSSFTPGKLVNFVENEQINVLTNENAYLLDVMNHSVELIESAFGEGYWSDHFDYLYDLVEDYLSIYPDEIDNLLFNTKTYKTFVSPVTVVKQQNKSVIKEDGEIRQYGSLLHNDQQKVNQLQLDVHGSNWVKIKDDVYKTNLYTKMLMLVLNKHALIDQDFYGVEMDGEKPGWNDAMNGVPGLFGSGVSEMIEVLRIVSFLKDKKHGQSIEIPIELSNLLKQLITEDSYEDRLNAREAYREKVRFGITGEYEKVNFEELEKYFFALETKITEKIKELYEINDGIIPTFITHEVTQFEAIKSDGQSVIGNYNLPIVKPLKFKTRFLPNFLEAPARLFKSGFDKNILQEMYKNIKKSEIYDAELKMYKTSASLDDESIEIGRIRAFTKGWLERESNFLHMTYKYLLGLIKSELYEEFYEELKTNLVCFMNPEVYKRSTLENSSFIASTNNPNKYAHGKGFFARLSGSTIETIDMWKVMMTGGQPFKYIDGELILKFEPKLHKDFFKEDGTLSFTFMKEIQITYVNETKSHTYDNLEVSHYEISDGEDIKIIKGSFIPSFYAKKVRSGEYKKIKVVFK
ncbi:MAG: hypothetical protein JXC31_01045 [Acholeplasmataceae bacterium]|nr:hypothetical protein [Acholeplasmataceae bacterium]